MHGERIKLKRLLIAFVIVVIVMILGIAISRSVSVESARLMLSNDFIESVSAQTLEEMKKDIQNNTSDNILRDVVASEVFSDAFSKVLTDTVGEEYVREISDKVLEHIIDQVIEQSNDALSQFIDEQGMGDEIATIIENELGGKDIKNIITTDLEKVKNNVYDEVKSTLNEYITNNSSNYSYELSEDELLEILNNVMAGNSSGDNKQQGISKEELTSLKNNLKSPSININSLLGSEADKIGSQAADVAGTEVFKQLTDLANKVESVQKTSADLASKIEALEKQDISNIQNNITNITTSINEINTIANDLASKIDVKNKSLFELKDDKVTKLDTSNMTIAEFVGVLSSNQKTYTDMLNKLESYIEKVDATSSSNYVELAKGVADLEAGLALSNSAIADLTSALSKEVGDRMQSISDLRQTIDKDIDVINTSFNTYKSYVESTHATKDELKKSENDLKDALTDMSTNLADKYDTLDKESQSTASDINNRIESILGALSSGGEIGSSIDILEKCVIDINNNVQNLQTDLSDLTISVNKEIQDRVEAMNVLKENLSTDIDNVSNSLNNYKNYVESTYAKPAEIEKAKTELTNSLNTLSNTVSGNKALFDELNAYTHSQVENIDTSINNIHNTLDSHATDISNINADIITLFSSVNSLTSGLGSCTDSITQEIADRIKGDKDLLEKFQKELQNKIDLVNSSMSAYKEVVENTYAKPSDIEAAKNNLEASLSTLQTQISNISNTNSTEISNLNTAINNFKTEVSNTYATKTAITNLQNSLNTIETTVNSHQTNISNLSTSVSNLQSRDVWVTGITLRNTNGTSSGKDVYRTVDGSGNWIYNVYGSNIGATLTSASDITIQYNASTPDIVVSYSQSNNLLQIIIDKDYVSLITGNITIDSMHIENN